MYQLVLYHMRVGTVVGSMSVKGQADLALVLIDHHLYRIPWKELRPCTFT